MPDTGSPSDAVVAVLYQLASQDQCTPETVVAKAKSKRSVLHDHFEWDDGVAGHQHRLQQARQLIARVKVIKTIDNQPTLVRPFVSVATQDDDHKYVIADDFKNDPDFHAAMISRFTAEQTTTRLKYIDLVGEGDVQTIIKAIYGL